MACWVAELIPHTELAPPGRGGRWEPISLGHEAGLLSGANPARQKPAACAARALGTQHVLPCLPGSPRVPDLCRSTFSPRFHAFLPSLLFFFFFFPLVLSVHCLASFFFYFFPIAHRPSRYPSKLQYLGPPWLCVFKMGFYPPRARDRAPHHPAGT